MKTAIVWLTTDLRLRDNETLTRAIAQADQIIPIVCLSPTDLAISPFGFPKMGYFRLRFFSKPCAIWTNNYVQSVPV